MNDQMTQAGDGWGDNSNPKIDREEEGRRRYLTVDGKEWVLEARDPFGMWWVVQPSGGTVPLALSGAYTGLWEAEQGLKQYMSQHPVSPAKKEAVEQKTTPPEIKFKKAKVDGPTRTRKAEEITPSEVKKVFSKEEKVPKEEEKVNATSEDSFSDEIFQGKVSEKTQSDEKGVKEPTKDHKDVKATQKG